MRAQLQGPGLKTRELSPSTSHCRGTSTHHPREQRVCVWGGGGTLTTEGLRVLPGQLSLQCPVGRGQRGMSHSGTRLDSGHCLPLTAWELVSCCAVPTMPASRLGFSTMGGGAGIMTGGGHHLAAFCTSFFLLWLPGVGVRALHWAFLSPPCLFRQGLRGQGAGYQLGCLASKAQPSPASASPAQG